MTYKPLFVSEREGAHVHLNGASDDSRWEDCVFTSGLMMANAATLGKYPATLTEAENIRDAAGVIPTGPTTNNQLNLGLSRRYGWTGQRVGASWPTFLAAVPVGYGVAFAGSFAGFPYGHTLRRFLPNYTGGHEVFAIHEGNNVWWWMDPLGPQTGYAGQAVSDYEIRTFLAGNTDGGTVAKVGVWAPRATVQVNILPAPNPRVWTVRTTGYLRAWDPYQPGGPVQTSYFQAGSWAYCDAEVWIDQPTRQVPDGGPFLRTVGPGAFAPGLLIIKSEVDLAPVPAPPAPPAPAPVPEPEPLPDPIPAPIPPVEPEPIPEPAPVPVPTPTPTPYVPPTLPQIGQIIGGGVAAKPQTPKRRKNITQI